MESSVREIPICKHSAAPEGSGKGLFTSLLLLTPEPKWRGPKPTLSPAVGRVHVWGNTRMCWAEGVQAPSRWLSVRRPCSTRCASRVVAGHALRVVACDERTALDLQGQMQ